MEQRQGEGRVQRDRDEEEEGSCETGEWGEERSGEWNAGEGVSQAALRRGESGMGKS